jgi:type IV pilus assembly protein PilN
MRIDINLAGKPYEDAQQFARQWGLLLGGVTILTIALVAGAFVRLREWRTEGRRIGELRAKISQSELEISRAHSFLDRPENRDTRDKSQILNELIARKAFSWTQVFTDLERIMPPRLHVVAIRPELTQDNQLELRMVVAGESRERALDLLKKMEQSPRFRQPQIVSESAQQSPQTPGDNVQFDISALYVPQTLPEPPSQPAQYTSTQTALVEFGGSR